MNPITRTGLALWTGWAMGVAALPAAGLRVSDNLLAWMIALPALAAGLLGLVRGASQAGVVLYKHTWLLAWLTLGSVGSLIGATAAFPLLSIHDLPGAAVWWLSPVGPALALLLRPLGSRAAMRFGAARISAWAFAAMTAAALTLWWSWPQHLPSYLSGFTLLFGAAGIATGSTLRLLPEVFSAIGHADAGAAASGFSGAMAAFGGFVMPKSLGSAIAWTGTPVAAFVLFALFYASCLLLTWWHYGRRFAPIHC